MPTARFPQSSSAPIKSAQLPAQRQQSLAPIASPAPAPAPASLDPLAAALASLSPAALQQLLSAAGVKLAPEKHSPAPPAVCVVPYRTKSGKAYPAVVGWCAAPRGGAFNEAGKLRSNDLFLRADQFLVLSEVMLQESARIRREIEAVQAEIDRAALA